jgi:hypothetical protein
VPRSAALIQTEITALEAEITNYLQSVGSDGTNATRAAYEAKTQRLDQLYIQLDRANATAPMIVRGVIKGLR